MSLHEGEENQPSSYHMLEVPLKAVAVGKDVDNKEIKEKEKIVGDVASHQKRSRKLTEKGWSLKLSSLSSTRRKINSRLVQQFWNNRRLDVLIKELCDGGRGISTV